MIDHGDGPFLPADWEAGWQVWLRAALWHRAVAEHGAGDAARRAVLQRQAPDVAPFVSADWAGAFAGTESAPPWPGGLPEKLAGVLEELEAALLRIGFCEVPSAYLAWLDPGWGAWPPAALAPRPAERDETGFVPLPVGEVALPLAWPAAIASAGRPMGGCPPKDWSALLQLARMLRRARAGMPVVLDLGEDFPGGARVNGVAERLREGLLASALPVSALAEVRAGIGALGDGAVLRGGALYAVLDGLREEPVMPWELQAGAWLAFRDMRASWSAEALAHAGTPTEATDRLGAMVGAFMDLVRKSLETAALHRLLRDAVPGRPA